MIGKSCSELEIYSYVAEHVPGSRSEHEQKDHHKNGDQDDDHPVLEHALTTFSALFSLTFHIPAPFEHLPT